MQKFKNRLIITFLKSQRGAAGIDLILEVAAIITIAAYILIPQFRSFTNDIISQFNTWRTGISGNLFPAS